MKTIFALAALSAALFLTGCVGVVPLPQKTGEPKLEAGREISRTETSFIVPHQSKREDIVQRMGKDYYESPRCAAIAYTWQYPARQCIWWLVGSMGGAVDCTEVGRWHGVFIAFAADGSVSAVDTRQLSNRKSLDEQLEKWAVNHGAASKISRPVIVCK